MASSFQPSVWGDFFINYSPPISQNSEEWMKERANQLKEHVRGLFGLSNDAAETLHLVDALQRLGIQHHFEEQIVDALRSIHSAEFNSCNLHHVALRFRLLRQHGFWVSPDEFDKFKTEGGTFNSEITNDPRGLLSLYNAAHLLTHGEAVLEEAILFSRHHLESMASKLKSPLAEQVRRALQIPLPRTMERIETLNYISEYKHEEAYNPSLLELAKLDFNLLQRFHVSELKTISQWWKDLYGEVGLSYARDRMVECYFWAFSVYYEQEHTRARMILAKVFALTSLLDDTYDVFATLEDSRKLNEAIQRWDLSCVSVLPEYMKKYYIKLISTFREVEEELKPEEKFRVAYNIKMFQTLSQYYFQEAQWFHSNYVPSFKEHIDVSIITSGAPMICVALLVGMGEVATKEAFEWAIGCPDTFRAAGEVTRFVDDIAAFKNGKNKMDVANSVECYIKEYKVTDDVAIAKIESLDQDAWKTMNQAFLDGGAWLPLVKRAANLAMSMEFLFQNNRDAYTFSKYSKDTIEQLFVKPIPL
ncbi:hypothetical protein ACP70R_012386 [Stipagrostis hirtigluma subsp. patula]